VAKALNHFHQDQITYHQRRHPQETIEPFHFRGSYTIEKVDPD